MTGLSFSNIIFVDFEKSYVIMSYSHVIDYSFISALKPEFRSYKVPSAFR